MHFRHVTSFAIKHRIIVIQSSCIWAKIMCLSGKRASDHAYKSVNKTIDEKSIRSLQAK